MFSTTRLLSTVLLALSVAGMPAYKISETNPSFGLSFAMHLNVGNTTLPELDRARASHLYERGKQKEADGTPAHSKRAASSFSVTNTAITYSTNVGIGSPASTYTLLIDTGSANTWVGATKAYKATSSSSNTGKTVSVSYGSGSFSGLEYTDTVSLSSSLVISKQYIGVANRSDGFSGVDGILGLGPAYLTQGTVSGMSTVPTVSDSLFSQGQIPTEVLGISYNPTTSTSSSNGELTFGGVDTNKYTGSITYSQITTASPSRYYWGIQQSVTYGSSSANVLSTTSGIVDTGTTLILLASDAFNRYKTLTGATVDTATGLLRLPSSSYSNLQSLFFIISGTKFELTPNAQIWPRNLNYYIGGSSGYIYLIVGDMGSNSGTGMDFINGYTFLERFYSVYDSSNKRVGIANTPNTKATTN